MDVALRECHDVSVCPGVQRLRFTSTVICRVVNGHRVVEVELVLKDDQFCMLVNGE